MSNVQYKEGYDAYVNKQYLTDEELKQKSSLYRNGYRTAMSDMMKKNNTVFPTTLYDIPRRPEVFVASWTDIMASTRRPRFAKLHVPHMQPVLMKMMKQVESKSSEITRYADVLRLMDEAFDDVLQYGYNEGVLTADDCRQYNYEPK